jgi:hypothetical protein
MKFHEVATFNACHVGVFWLEAGGPSPWEMHPDCNEILLSKTEAGRSSSRRLV